MGFMFTYMVPDGRLSTITEARGQYNRVILGTSSNEVLRKIGSNRARYSADIRSGFDLSWAGIPISVGSKKNLYVEAIVEGRTANFVAG